MNAKNKIFLELSQDLKCQINFDGYFEGLTLDWEGTLGYTIEELKSKPFIEFLHPDDPTTVSHEFNLLMEREITVPFETRFLGKDGSYRWFQWRAKADLKYSSVYAVVRDVNDRVEMEKRFLDYGKLFEILQDLNTDGWWDWNLDSNDIFFSPRAKVMFGYDVHEISSDQNSWMSLIHPEDRPTLLKTLTERLEEGKPFEPTIRFMGDLSRGRS